jgi:hypothetical protein
LRTVSSHRTVGRADNRRRRMGGSAAVVVVGAVAAAATVVVIVVVILLLAAAVEVAVAAGEAPTTTAAAAVTSGTVVDNGTMVFFVSLGLSKTQRPEVSHRRTACPEPCRIDFLCFSRYSSVDLAFNQK